LQGIACRSMLKNRRYVNSESNSFEGPLALPGGGQK
jgi:hypothetical protein